MAQRINIVFVCDCCGKDSDALVTYTVQGPLATTKFELCATCNEDFSAYVSMGEVVTASKTPSPVGSRECDEPGCGFVSKTPSGLATHYSRKHGVEVWFQRKYSTYKTPHPCTEPECIFVAKNAYGLRTHLKAHNKEVRAAA
jgi:hypothetical protein